MKNYRDKLNDKNLFYDDNFLYIFLRKRIKDIFRCLIKENGNIENPEKSANI
jgi:hypothetical protein